MEQSALGMKQSLEESATSSQEQLASVSEISTASEELAQSASEMAKSTEIYNKKVNDSISTMKEVLGSLEDLTIRVEEIGNKIKILGEKSQMINDIITLIEQTSNETHLLSINAAIEAAEAGEHGKRFAMVASEVRRLAEESKKALSEIDKVVKTIQDAVKESIFSADYGIKGAKRGREKLEIAGDSLKEMTLSFKEESELVEKIKITTSHQRRYLSFL